MDAYKTGFVEQELMKALEREAIYVAMAIVVVHHRIITLGFKQKNVGKFVFVKLKKSHKAGG